MTRHAVLSKTFARMQIIKQLNADGDGKRSRIQTASKNSALEASASCPYLIHMGGSVNERSMRRSGSDFELRKH